MGGHQGKGFSGLFSFPLGYNGFTVISNRGGQAIIDLSWVTTSPILKFNQITSRVKDSYSHHSSSILSLVIIWGLEFLCNDAYLCYAVCMYVHTCVPFTLTHMQVAPKLSLLRIWLTLPPTHLPGSCFVCQNGGGLRCFGPALSSAAVPSAMPRLLAAHLWK